jgi:hypothetical protein
VLDVSFLANGLLFFFADGSVDANWQSASKGYLGNVIVDGIKAQERTSGSFAYAGILSTNDVSLGAWQAIVNNNAHQATAQFQQTSLVSHGEAQLAAAFAAINNLTATRGYEGFSASQLDGINTQNNVAEVIVINIVSGFNGIQNQLHVRGDALDVFILRWDMDLATPGYQGAVKFQSGGAVVPQGGLAPGNFINVAGDMTASGGGSNPPAPYPQGPRFANGTMIANGADFGGGGFFTGYWLTTGDPSSRTTQPMSNAVFVGGWYTTTTQFSLTSGCSGVHVSPFCLPCQ